jgi:hypothetical protein
MCVRHACHFTRALIKPVHTRNAVVQYTHPGLDANTHALKMCAARTSYAEAVKTFSRRKHVLLKVQSPFSFSIAEGLRLRCLPTLARKILFNSL